MVISHANGANFVSGKGISLIGTTIFNILVSTSRSKWQSICASEEYYGFKIKWNKNRTIGFDEKISLNAYTLDIQALFIIWWHFSVLFQDDSR